MLGVCPASTKTALDLHWLLAYDGESEKPKFNSRLIIGNKKKIPLTYKGRHKLPLNLDVNYKLFYNPFTDKLNLDHFSVSFLKKTWLNLAGEVTAIRNLEIAVNEPLSQQAPR